MTLPGRVPTVEIAQVIGERIAQAREESEWSQAELGSRLGELLGKPWSRQAVWTAEQGRRVFTAVELVALAYVFDVSIERLMRPFREIDGITMPGGQRLEWSELIEPTIPDSSLGVALHEAHTQVADIVHLLGNLSDVSNELTASVSDLSGHVDRAIRHVRDR